MNSRYCRQIPIIGKAGQKSLETSSILVIGSGGVGSPLLLYLAGAGVGKLGIIDFDSVDLSNLQRQILFVENDIGQNKAIQASKHLKDFNSDINIHTYSEKLTILNAKDIFKKYDLIIDGSDNFQTRYLTNDICCQLNLPFISASIFQSQIQIVVVDPKEACYRCIFPTPPPPNIIQNCSMSGIIGANAGIAGSMSASIAIQIITNSSKKFFNQVIKINCNDYSINKFDFSKLSECSSCSKKLILWPALSNSINLNDINLEDYLVVDIRELSEARSQILSSQQQHLPFSQLIKNPNQLPKVKILLYCSRGIRSEYAANLLRSKGYDASSVNN